jgi:ABC-2 type transport system permease protein
VAVDAGRGAASGSEGGMTTLWAVFTFELREQARHRGNYFFFGILFALGLLVTVVAGSDAQAWINEQMHNDAPVLANGPFLVRSVTLLLLILGLLGLSGALFGRSATRDADCNFYPLLATSGVREWQYVLGRLLATWLVALVILAGIDLGLLAGLALPWINPAYVGPLQWRAYVAPYLLHVAPYTIILGAIYFTVGLLGRRTLWVYLTALALLIAEVKFQWLEPLRGQPLPTKYWTPAEWNYLLVPVTGQEILNRLLWLGLIVVGLAVFMRWFRFSRPALSLPILLRRGAGRERPVAMSVASRTRLGLAPPARLQSGPWARIGQLWEQTRFELRPLVANRWLLIVLATGIGLSIFSTVQGLDESYGVPEWPTTARILANTALFMMVLAPFLAFFLGESVWRERDSRIAELVDAAPTPSWVFYGGKLLAAVLLSAFALGTLLVAAVVAQTALGYYHYELSLYATRLFTMDLVQLVLLLVPVLLIHVLVSNKYVGHFLSLMLLAVLLTVPSLPPGLVPHPDLWVYAFRPDPPYSDLNGYGHFLGPVRLYQLYWAIGAVLLLALANLGWPRGRETALQPRLRVAAQRLRGPLRQGLLIGLVAFVALSGVLYYHTEVLYATAARREPATPESDAARQALVDYLDRYAALADAQPMLTDVYGEFDLFPAERRLEARVRYTLQNQTDRPITDVLLNDGAQPGLSEVRLGALTVPTELHQVLQRRVYHFQLPEPLAPGATVEASFVYRRLPLPGFTAGENDLELVHNGTVLPSDAFLPEVGYLGYLRNLLRERADEETGSGGHSHRHGRHGEIEAQARPDDDPNEARRWSALGIGGRRVGFAGVISTDADQTALLPGSLQREWSVGQRRYFEYRADAPITLMFFVLSGRYAVQRAQHGDVTLEVYYHPEHAFNVDRLLQGMRESLDYMSASFGPYPYRHLRIVDAPDQLAAAISTPGTLIFASPMGLASRLPQDRPGVVDFPLYITAHETAHQWWAHQVNPARADGAYLVAETLSQYSALVVMERVHGPASVRSFLKYELEGYLSGRGSRDVPLARTAGSQHQHVYYGKGSVVMYALRDYLGEEVVNDALARFLHDYREGPPYALASDLLDYLRAATPPDQQYLLADLLDTVTLWNNQALTATATARADGGYDVTMTVRAHKARFDSAGHETPLEMNDLIDIGVLDAHGSFIYLAKHPIQSGENTVTVSVDREPAKAGIDPMYKLIDRQTGDNVVAVERSDTRR